MSISTGDDDYGLELEVEVEAELTMTESSRAEETIGLPVTEWLFDPVDVEREEIGLRDLLGAAEALEGDPPSGRPADGRA